MDFSFLLGVLSELSFLLVTFGFFLTFAVFQGRQATINLTIGLYLGLFLFLVFPYKETLFGSLTDDTSSALAQLLLFTVFSVLTTVLAYRTMPDEFRETKLESFNYKLLLALGATMLVMTFSFHLLPVTDLLTPGSPVQALFSPAEYHFWWLVAPLGILFFAS
jgi:uncharacterized membrane protein